MANDGLSQELLAGDIGEVLLRSEKTVNYLRREWAKHLEQERVSTNSLIKQLAAAKDEASAAEVRCQKLEDMLITATGVMPAGHKPVKLLLGMFVYRALGNGTYSEVVQLTDVVATDAAGEAATLSDTDGDVVCSVHNERGWRLAVPFATRNKQESPAVAEADAPASSTEYLLKVSAEFERKVLAVMRAVYDRRGDSHSVGLVEAMMTELLPPASAGFGDK